ncbi:MAG: hypothetical protein ACR2PI_09205 [Hyphomicrobiaceae bacterium]
MTKKIREAYETYILGQMIIDELQRVFDGPIPICHPALEIEEQGEAYRLQAAWIAATSDAEDSNDLVLKSWILRSYSEEDPDDVISKLVHSMCSDITRLMADDVDMRRDALRSFETLSIRSDRPLSQI